MSPRVRSHAMSGARCVRRRNAHGTFYAAFGLMGTDAPTFDPPVWAMFERKQFWEAHMVMMDEDYWHLENLMNLNQLRSPVGSTILGAAVIDDVLGLTVLSIVIAAEVRGAVPHGGPVRQIGECEEVFDHAFPAPSASAARTVDTASSR